MKLSPITQKFVLHWGEMGARWGVNRTVAQVHALLYVATRPLHAEDLTSALGVARSNISTSLKELQGWGLIKVVHVLGDRRDHFESLKDPWEMLRQVLDERKRREIDPTIDLLRECVAEAERAGSTDPTAAKRLADLLQFFETMTGWYDEMRRLPRPLMVQFVKLGGKVRRFLGRG